MTTEQMPAFIEEANLLYATDPAGAVALLYEGTRKLKERMPETVEFKKKAREQRSERERQLMLLELAHRLMGDLLEDVNDGILPDQLEWELDVGVAQDIVRLTRKYGI